ncbi:hypothetical protein D3C81_1707850 [compost metagenome]
MGFLGNILCLAAICTDALDGQLRLRARQLQQRLRVLHGQQLIARHRSGRQRRAGRIELQVQHAGAAIDGGLGIRLRADQLCFHHGLASQCPLFGK